MQSKKKSPGEEEEGRGRVGRRVRDEGKKETGRQSHEGDG